MMPLLTMPPLGATPAEDDTIGREEARVRLAARANTPPEMLETLAADPALMVRAAVALNPTFAPAAHERLLTDENARIRTLLAGKLARLLPSLSGQEQSAAQAHVHAMLMVLAQDAAERVRQTIAEAVIKVPDAPRALVLALARDPAFAVSDPVVRFSPSLTDDDLLELLATPPHAETATAIARRKNLSAVVADDIAAHASSAVVAALLANRSATIQEATLDALVGRAGDHPEWHEPLVSRPVLPLRSLRALSKLVAGHLLTVLASRPDVTPELAGQLREQVTETLEGPAAPNDAAILEEVVLRKERGELTEDALLEAVTAGEPRMVEAILSVCSETPIAAIDRAVGLRSAKALVSLVARAGFSMEAAVAVQGLLGRLGPGELIRPSAEGGFSLSEAEMDWQIELLAEPGR